MKTEDMTVVNKGRITHMFKIRQEVHELAAGAQWMQAIIMVGIFFVLLFKL